MTRTSVLGPAILLAAAVVVSGCSAATPSKAGGAAPPITLTLGTDDPKGRLSGTLIEEFARQVTTLSEGGIVIKPVWRAAGQDQASWDQKVAGMVRSGEIDMGMIPARAWDTEGVSSFRALHAPFLVDSNALVDAVVADDVALDMLTGLDPLGVTGLALVPESLRHPFSFAEPVLEPADLVGKAIRTPRSEVSYAVLEALGAKPTEATPPEGDFAASVADGTILAAESSFDGALSLPSRAVGTANVTFYPKVQTLVANVGVLAGLSAEQRAALTKAAAQTRTWAVDGVPRDSEAARSFCAAGFQSVLAPESALDAWLTSASPVYEQLEKDPATARMITTIRQLKQSTKVSEGERAVACGAEGAKPQPSVIPAQENVIPEGTYRRDNTLRDLVAAGFPEPGASQYVGALTFTLKGGVYTETPPAGAGFQACVGSYSSSTTRLEVRFEEHCSGTLTAAWTIGATGLVLSDVKDTTSGQPAIVMEAIFGADRPFTKIE